VQIHSRVQLATLVLAIFSFALVANAWPHKHGQKVRVRFLAESTFLRGTWGLNEDTYLAELKFPSNGESFLVRLVDRYPNEFPSISRETLTSENAVVVSVIRDHQCDGVFEDFLSRAAPGDLMAILPMRLSYKPHLTNTPPPGESLPCYRISR
jgi:hypothetical protein